MVLKSLCHTLSIPPYLISHIVVTNKVNFASLVWLVVQNVGQTNLSMK